VNEIGTLAWTRRARGQMSPGERLAFLARGVATQLGAMSDRTLFSLGIGRDRLARLDLESLRWPDTPAVREAADVADGFPKWLWHHSQRSYVWCVALAQLDGLTGYDEEALYVGCLLHDAGLPPAVEARDDACFTIRSADLAAECVTRAGWDDSRRDHLCESITLHVNPYVPPAQSLEGHLLGAGTTLDAVALRRAWRIDPTLKSAVLERHPRHGIKKELRPVLKAHAKAAPRSRIAFMWRYGPLGTLVARAPWPE
jgi:hypothetical protein